MEMFVCGPTVYDLSHLGHARTYIFFDMVAKYLRYLGYKVFYLQNITDVDDKIIERAKRENLPWREISKKFKKEYFKDIKALGITSVNKYAPATKYIKEIQSQVRRLLEKGYAYEIEGEGIYYDISKFKDYGRLSRRTVLQAEDAISRVDEAVKKKNKGDFALWKYSKPGEPAWPSPWGRGRPGWHIEDTAITEKHFGPQYDLHGGARDLIFPHHEAEISQMEAISGKKPLVKYWLHPGFLTVKGRKMAKSLGNFITIRDFLKDNQARLLRLLVLKSHYRSSIDYNYKLVWQTRRELERIDEFTDKLKSQITNHKPQTKPKFQILKFQKRFEKAMEDDFNTPKAMAVIFNLLKKTNQMIDKNVLTRKEAREILSFLKDTDRFFHFIFWGKRKKAALPQKIHKLIQERESARLSKDWQKADKIRKKIQQLGYQIEDTKEGPRLKKM